MCRRRGRHMTLRSSFDESALAELRGAAGGLEAVLLALLHSGVAGEEAGGLEGGAVVLIDDDQGAGDAVADGAVPLYTLRSSRSYFPMSFSHSE